MRSRVEIAWAVRRAGVSGRGAGHRCNRLLLAAGHLGGMAAEQRLRRLLVPQAPFLRPLPRTRGGRLAELGAGARPGARPRAGRCGPGDPGHGRYGGARGTCPGPPAQRPRGAAGAPASWPGARLPARKPPGAGAGEDAGRLTSRVDAHLDQAGGLLTPAQRAMVRDCASRLAWLVRGSRPWPATGISSPVTGSGTPPAAGWGSSTGNARARAGRPRSGPAGVRPVGRAARPPRGLLRGVRARSHPGGRRDALLLRHPRRTQRPAVGPGQRRRRGCQPRLADLRTIA